MYYSDFVFAVVMVAGGEHLSKNTNSGVVGENKSNPIEEQETH